MDLIFFDILRFAFPSLDFFSFSGSFEVTAESSGSAEGLASLVDSIFVWYPVKTKVLIIPRDELLNVIYSLSSFCDQARHARNNDKTWSNNTIIFYKKYNFSYNLA